MPDRVPLPPKVEHLVTRVLTSRSASLSPETRRAVFDHVAALSRQEEPPPIPPAFETYVRKTALNAYKVLDREVTALRESGCSVDDVFEITVAAAVSAGVTRMRIALAALEEVADASAS